jgi:hypothetical protein
MPPTGIVFWPLSKPAMSGRARAMGARTCGSWSEAAWLARLSLRAGWRSARRGRSCAAGSINRAPGADPTAVVRQFYNALGQAEGATAAGFVVAEKRHSGPFSPAALTGFHGALASPLEIVDIALLPDGRVRTHHHNRQANGRRCNGVPFARVTASPEGIVLIAGIETPDGC